MTHCVTHDKSVTILVRGILVEGRREIDPKRQLIKYSFICLLYNLEWETHAMDDDVVGNH